MGRLRGRDDTHDSFVRRWYSGNLAAMEEPSLSCGSLEDTEVYRFLWLRSFGDPVAVRVFQRADVYRLEAVVLDQAGRYSENYRRWLLSGTGGYTAPGKVSRRVTKKLSREQWRTVIASLDEVRFWQLPTTSNRMQGTDGFRWIIEARRDGRYHVVDRWDGEGLVSVADAFFVLAALGKV